MRTLFLIFSLQILGTEMQIDLLYSSKANELRRINPRLFDELAPHDLRYESVMKNLDSMQNPNLIYLNKINRVIENIEEIAKSLNLVGDFIREHTFHERDFRIFNETISQSYYESMVLKKSFDKEAAFLMSFPKEPILNENSEVVKNCKKSASSCIQFVANIAT